MRGMNGSEITGSYARTVEFLILNDIWQNEINLVSHLT